MCKLSWPRKKDWELNGPALLSTSFVILKVLAGSLPPERGNHAQKWVSLLAMLLQPRSLCGSLKINESMV